MRWQLSIAWFHNGLGFSMAPRRARCLHPAGTKWGNGSFLSWAPLAIFNGNEWKQANIQTILFSVFPFFGEVVLFSSDMGMNVNFKKSSSKQGKNIQRGVWGSSATRCPKSRGSQCPLAGVAGCGHCAVLQLSPAPGLAALSLHSLLAKPPTEVWRGGSQWVSAGKQLIFKIC